MFSFIYKIFFKNKDFINLYYISSFNYNLKKKYKNQYLIGFFIKDIIKLLSSWYSSTFFSACFIIYFLLSYYYFFISNTEFLLNYYFLASINSSNTYYKNYATTPTINFCINYNYIFYENIYNFNENIYYTYKNYYYIWDRENAINKSDYF